MLLWVERALAGPAAKGGARRRNPWHAFFRRKADGRNLQPAENAAVLNAHQVHLLRKSFAAIEAHGAIAALLFYRLLFQRHPGLRPLFTGGIEEQSAKLIAMLGALIAMLGEDRHLTAELEAMGARHAGYGVCASHYDAVGHALLAMAAEVMGEHFTAEVRDAWTALYRMVAEAMQRGAAAAAIPAR